MQKIFIAGFCLLWTVLPSFAAQASGFVRPESCSFLIRERLYLQRIDRHSLPKPVVFAIPGESAWDHMVNTPYSDLPGDCTRMDECASVRHSKLMIRHVSRSMFIPFRGRRIKGLSGEFAVELSDGTKFEGSFKVKRSKSQTIMICE